MMSAASCPQQSTQHITVQEWKPDAPVVIYLLIWYDSRETTEDG